MNFIEQLSKNKGGKERQMKRYLAKPFSQSRHETLYAVWDYHTNNYVIEPNGMVYVEPDLKLVLEIAQRYFKS